MTLDQERIQELFNAAMKLASAEREPFLDKECGENDSLRCEVESLLEYSFSSTPTVQSSDTILDYKNGDMIGSFKILNVLGEGGMGIVYLAEQNKPVRRKVALKVIKAGMDTKQVIARFEAERQALAIMNHPGISQVYEAGATETGRPYFVMEHVKGMPITEACDEQKLNTIERLELMAKVCDAVQHAHTKAIIHRDLKPNNILVSIADDGTLEPKIIDFGVAKATSQKLTEKTLMPTQVGRFIGTFAYTSPEQADLKAIDIDAKTDVYALGVILYEVLTGMPPFDPQLLHEAGLEKMREIIRTQPPPKPSTQLSSISDSTDGAKIAQARQTQIAALAGLLRKELEWIPLKALKKLRSERYDSARSMGDDIRRYLAGDALEAVPESALYRFKKTLRKHKVAALAIATVFVVLVLAVVAIAIFALEAKEQAEIAQESQQETVQGKTRAEAQLDFLTKMLSFGNPKTASQDGNDTLINILAIATKKLDKMTADQPLKAKLHSSIGETYEHYGKYPEAEVHYTKALEIRRSELGDEHEDTLTSHYNMGSLLLRQEDFVGAEEHLKKALETRRRILGNNHQDTLKSITIMGNLFFKQRKFKEAEKYYLEALKGRVALLGNEHEDTLKAMNNMGILLATQSKFVEAEEYFARAIEVYRGLGKASDPETLNLITNMGKLLTIQKKYPEAEKCYLEALKGRRRVLGPEHESTLNSISGLSELYKAWNKPEKAQRYRDLLPKKDKNTP